MTLTEPQTRERYAPDLYGSAWLNGEPYTIRRSSGDTVLLDFWSTTCVRCLRDIPFLNRWKKVYADAGLVVIGVHHPGFDFAEKEAHVRSVIKKAGITYRVVLDNEESIRSAYGIHERPSRLLIDRNGMVRFIQRGTADEVEFERAIQSMLRESGFRGELPSLFDVLQEGATARVSSGREMFCGYLRGTLGNTEGYAPESLQFYEDPGTTLEGRLYLSGTWWAGRDSLVSRPEGKDACAVRMVFDGGDVFAVLSSPSGHATLTVSLDGTSVPSEVRGADVSAAGDGSTTVPVEAPGMYHLLHAVPDGQHALVCSSTGGEVGYFQFSIEGARSVARIHRN